MSSQQEKINFLEHTKFFKPCIQPEIKSIACPICSSKNIRKYGTKRAKLQNSQRYQCKDCNKIFTLKEGSNKTYPLNIILNAVSYYNLGYSQAETIKLLANKFKPSQKTVSNWINEYKPICTYDKLRKKAIKLFKPKDIIFSSRLNHQQVYNFQYHKAKLELLFKDKLYNNQFHNTSHFYDQIKQYLEKIPTKAFPHHIFKGYKEDNDNRITYNWATQEIEDFPSSARLRLGKPAARGQLRTYTRTSKLCPSAEIAENKNHSIKNSLINEKQRASQIKFSHLEIKHIKKQNYATKLAKLALNLAKSNKQRHEAIQNFFLINDSTTIAVEIPIYLTNWDSGYYYNQKGFIFPIRGKTPITGHIDILQIRNGLIHILDYKPEANKQKPIEQLTLYALALSRKINLPLYWFKCAWFDENNYFEFFPLHGVYEKR